VKILSPRDNALFLATWRERMRPAVVLSIGIVAAVVIALVVVGCHSKAASDAVHGWSRHAPREWLGWAFGIVAGLQGFVLLVVGSAWAGNVAARERTGGTLDFHRTSPTRRIDQVLGLLFGAPVLEWCVFGATLPVSLILALAAGIRFGTFLGFYVSLVVTAVFCHSLAVAAGLAGSNKRTGAKSNGTGALVPVVLFVLSLIAIPMRASALFHAASLPAYIRLSREAFLDSNALPDAWRSGALFTFYHVRLPSLLLQLVVQVPFTVLAWIAAIRNISRPERPMLSKTQWLGCIALVFFLSVGSALPILDVLAVRGWGRYDHSDTAVVMAFFFYIAIFLGLISAAGATPGHLLHLKGLSRMRKLGRARLGLMDDEASNRAWLAGFVALFAVSYVALGRYLLWPSTFEIIAAPVIMVCYVAWFAGALEYFRVSRFRSSKGLFAVAIAILWIVIPMFGVFAMWPSATDEPSFLFFAPSPVFGPLALAGGLGGGMSRLETLDFMATALVVNLALAVATLELAGRERKRCASDAELSVGGAGH